MSEHSQRPDARRARDLAGDELPVSARIPADLRDDLDALADHEHTEFRHRSEVVRTALAHYLACDATPTANGDTTGGHDE